MRYRLGWKLVTPLAQPNQGALLLIFERLDGALVNDVARGAANSQSETVFAVPLLKTMIG